MLKCPHCNAEDAIRVKNYGIVEHHFRPVLNHDLPWPDFNEGEIFHEYYDSDIPDRYFCNACGDDLTETEVTKVLKEDLDA